METKGISSKIPVELHHWIETELRPDDSVLSGFIEAIIERYYELKEAGTAVAKKPKVVSFPVSDELYQKIMEYLAESERVYGCKLTQTVFMVRLVEQALDEAGEEFAAARAALGTTASGQNNAEDKCGPDETSGDRGKQAE